MNKLTSSRPILVAHRGYSGRYPENTLLAYQAAYEHGARYMELDLQMTHDLVPVFHHDISLLRMAGIDLDVRDISIERLQSFKASYSERFADEFTGNTFSTLREFLQWLKQDSQVITFIEIKQESIDRFGLEVFVDQVHDQINDIQVASQCVIISFNNMVVEYSRKLSPIRTGWVLPKWNDENQRVLERLKPDFLFCDRNFLPDEDENIWRGSWQWAIYNLDDVSSAIEMANRDIPFLETNQIGTLLSDKQLAG